MFPGVHHQGPKSSEGIGIAGTIAGYSRKCREVEGGGEQTEPKNPLRPPPASF
jgi:hypothetical protein